MTYVPSIIAALVTVALVGWLARELGREATQREQAQDVVREALKLAPLPALPTDDEQETAA